MNDFPQRGPCLVVGPVALAVDGRGLAADREEAVTCEVERRVLVGGLRRPSGQKRQDATGHQRGGGNRDERKSALIHVSSSLLRSSYATLAVSGNMRCAGMGPCQSRRCREQVGLLLAQAAGTSIDRIPLPSFRPPIRPLPLNVLWPTDEPPAMREEWVSWFGIPTQFSPHWEAGMAIAEPTAQTRLILSDE